MDKRDWLLLTIGECIQPIQLQKTLFKFAKESEVAQSEVYEFAPYNWGPCSFDLYNDLRNLRLEGLAEAIPSGHGWNAYRLTAPGRAKEKELLEQAKSPLIEQHKKIRAWVTKRDFEQLLNDVYKDYPEFATESLLIKK